MIKPKLSISRILSSSLATRWIVIYLGQDLHPGSSGTSRTRRYRTRPCTEVRILPFQSGCCHPDLPARGTSFLSIRSVSARTSHSLVGEWTGVTRYLFTPHQTVQDGVRTFLPAPDGTGQCSDFPPRTRWYRATTRQPMYYITNTRKNPVCQNLAR